MAAESSASVLGRAGEASGSVYRKGPREMFGAELDGCISCNACGGEAVGVVDDTRCGKLEVSSGGGSGIARLSAGGGGGGTGLSAGGGGGGIWTSSGGGGR